ncbi:MULTISPECIES: beta-N-acetylhexosaminidase [Streptomycetaceae]|uniref:beta-N-acetylhexosaminidase n=1 Tax=Streptantibioticus cattleyicolor (strain ATCC 35852 / DSM 46488 / JCM 4925 / NBRC 14057 / NRRL 8057) TaxID=1003195 RepID=F8JUC0_STREN|nr:MULTISPECIES: beta-N-acetylhexosaminidase [Streptomycetaceae]AEW94329.1 Beta-N-acetylhexosaminidase [Streptantibioticus cattleyicolor NRRL 8057 = DSM 46488]MYS58983.1 family 20 glycosylhydrolase [Streptomyces sp. SID5468]CCB74686.1 Sugar hydrolase [Streptantibioticus cattleyicolor NRRL 8057 = DSM 46488]
MDLIPAPRSLRRTEPGAAFVVDGRTRVDAGPGTERTERWLRGVLAGAFGVGLPPGEGAGALALRVDGSLGTESYRLTVRPDRAELVGGDPAGLFWGAQTLRQLLGPDAFRRAPIGAREARLPCVTVEDAPRFAWRGMLLDVARHFMPKDVVLRYLDLLAAHKLNVLHLHLTDDQGWRLEIRRYPKLTEVGAWRTRTKVGLRESTLWDERPHGGYYTQDDIREIVAYAAEREITVVPEIDVPGHSQAAIAAYPELGNTDVVDTTTLPVLTSWGVNPNVLAPTDTTVRFYENVLSEVLELFPATFVHIGGDECPKEQWSASLTAKNRLVDLELADEHELQSWFIAHFDRWLAERGRRLIGWDEILQGGLAPKAAVSSWRGYAGGIAAARAGHDVVMCPEQYVYLDHRQADGPDEPVPIGFVRTLEDVYRFEPVPAELTAQEAAHVMGTQANVWTEVLDSVRAVDYMAFPRLAAFAEVAWSALPAPAERDFAAFSARMRAHYVRLDALGVEYRPPGGPRPWQRRPGVVGRPIEGPPPIV